MEAVPDLLVDGPGGAAVTVVLAHGAGAPMDSPFMTAMAARLAARSHRVVRFEFPYMAARRLDGRRRPPDRQPALLACWRRVVDALGGGQRLVIGGKSMGGRMASLLAAEDGARGLVCLGYPFHPPGKPERTRVEHLAGLAVPALVVQGTRDPFGTAADVAGYRLSPSVSVTWIDDGDHDLKPRRSSGRDHDSALDEAAVAVDRFLGTLPA
ncbi:MAG: alpha/beta fold hydrolase [Thalassobaculum sp.]|uniref:alpha/beta family hydrolase n=1 Tax=Thalassobaculum sp. TaxID=2022740 RepID=UPI0032EEA63E